MTGTRQAPRTGEQPLVLRDLASLLVTLAALGAAYFVFRGNLDFVKVGDALYGTRLWAIGSAVAILILNFALSSERFRLILVNVHGSSPSFASLFGLTFISLFSAHLVAVGPSADVVRVVYGRLIEGLSLRTMVESVVYDRVLAVFASAGLGLVALPVQAWLGIPAYLWLPQLALWACCLMVLLTMTFAAAWIRRLWPRMASYVRPVDAFWPAVAGGGHAARQMVYATLHPLTFGAAMWLLARGMGLDLGWIVVLAFSPLFILGQSLPIFFVGWGMREAVVVGTLGTVGLLSASEALAVSIATGVAVFLATLPGLPLMLVLRRPSRPRELRP